MPETGFYISKQDLATVIDHYEANKPQIVGDKVLKGFVFRVGAVNNQAALLADPLYSLIPTGNPSTNDTVVDNDGISPGCPYPPGYPQP